MAGGRPSSEAVVMESADRIVTLDDTHLSRYSGEEIDDLIGYLDPSLVLVTEGVSPRRRRWLEGRISRPVLTVDRPGSFVHGARRYCVRPSPDVDAAELAGTSSDKAPCVIDTTVEETLDPHSMEAGWSGLEEYRRFVKALPDGTHHLAANLPAGRYLPPGDPAGALLLGSGPVEDHFDRSIPCLRVDDGTGTFLEETVRSSRVGLRAIADVGRKTERTLREAGIDRRDQLLDLDPGTLLELPGIGAYYACVLTAGSRALKEERPVWFASDPLANEPIVYLDIETDAVSSVSNIWQVGVYDEVTGNYRCFMDEEPGDPRTVPRRFARWVHEEAADRTFVAWYGKQFDFRWLDEFIRRHAKPEPRASWLATRRVDLLEDVVRSRVRLPARSRKLDVAARRLGYDRDREGLDGGDAARAYGRWRDGEAFDRERWMAYGRDDVLAMKHLYDRLREAPRPLDLSSLEARAPRGSGIQP